MKPTHSFPLWVVLLLAAGGLAHTVPAKADPLTEGERWALSHGQVVTRNVTEDDGSQRAVGGISYAVVDGSERDIAPLIENEQALRVIFPRTKSARWVAPPNRDGAPAETFFLELRQGTALFEGSYTVKVLRDRARKTYRFWLDPRFSHDIDDAWGFFRLTPWGPTRTLVTFAAMVDLGPGLVRELFEERLRAMLLSVPSRIRTHMAEATPDAEARAQRAKR